MSLTTVDGNILTNVTVTRSMIANGAVGVAQISPLTGLTFANTISTSMTITSGNNFLSVGPLTAANGAVITVSANSRWVIL